MLCQMQSTFPKGYEDLKYSFNHTICRYGENIEEKTESQGRANNIALVSEQVGSFSIDDDDGAAIVPTRHVGTVEGDLARTEKRDFGPANSLALGQNEPLFPLFSAWLTGANNSARKETVFPLHSEQWEARKFLVGRSAECTRKKPCTYRYSKKKAARQQREWNTRRFLKNLDNRFFIDMEPGQCRIPGCLLKALHHGHFGPACDCSRRDVPYPLSRVAVELTDHEDMHLHKNKSLFVGQHVLIHNTDGIWYRGTVNAQVGGGEAFGARTWQVLFDDLTTTQIADGERRVAVSTMKPKSSDRTPNRVEFYKKHANGNILLEAREGYA